MNRKIISLIVLLTWLLSACASQNQNAGSETATPAQGSPEKTAEQTEALTTQSQSGGTQAQCTVITRAPTPGPTEAALIPPVGEKDWIKGAPAGYVTILEYSDFM